MTTMHPPQHEHGGRTSGGSTGRVIGSRWRDGKQLAGPVTLSDLKSLSVDELKIDKSFITSICTNVNDEIMVRSTIAMARELGLSVVAEGVEDLATINLLKELKRDLVQGFAIGKTARLEAVWPEVAGRSRCHAA